MRKHEVKLKQTLDSWDMVKCIEPPNLKKVPMSVSVGGGAGGCSPPQAGKKSVSLGKIFWKNNRKFGKKFTELLQSRPSPETI